MTAAIVSMEQSFKLPSQSIPPQSIEAEEAILGGILLDSNAIVRVLEILRPEFFALLSHQIIYRVMMELHHQGKPTDLMTVVTRLGDRDLLEKVGGQMKIATLVERTISAVNIDQYAALVADKFIRRQLISVSTEIRELGYQVFRDLGEVLNVAEQKIFSLTQHRPHQDLVPIGDILVDSFQEIESRAEGAILPGVPTGFYDLDAMTGGFQRSDLIVVAGRSSMGKTTFAMNIAYRIATVSKLPVAIFSMEMSREQLSYRLLSSESNIPNGNLRDGRLSDRDWGDLIGAIAALSEEPIFIDDTTDITVNEMRSKARRLQAENGGALGLVLIDYLQLMSEGQSQNRNQELAQITRGLKILAKELNVPVVVLSQLSRGVEGRSNKRPIMSDLRDSGAIEQDADLILMLYRDEYYNPDSCDRGITEVIVTKHRNGATGTVKLLFQPEFTRFRSLAKRS